MSEQTDGSPATPRKCELGSGPLAGAERRVAVRYSCALKSLCQTKTGQPEDFWWWGNIRDISTTGMGLLISRQFEPGTQLVIEPLTGQEAFQPLLVRVIRTTKQTRGGWLLGCEFAGQPVGQSGDIAQLLPNLRRLSASDCSEVP